MGVRLFISPILAELITMETLTTFVGDPVEGLSDGLFDGLLDGLVDGLVEGCCVKQIE